MATPVIQTSFNSGEWAPALNARVDLAKYHSGASLLRNFFVDYRGGATTRPGLRYIQKCKGGGSGQVRLIPFQASFTVAYILEFGENYIRFYRDGVPILGPGGALTITGITQANPCVISVVNTYAVGDWIYIASISGMTELNGNYYIITARTAGTVTIADLFGNPVNSTGFNPWTANGTIQSVYQLTTTYLASELSEIKYAQDVNALILCHPNHAPRVLTLISVTNWTLLDITFGSTVTTPTGLAYASTYAGGAIHNSYVVTAVDSNGQESGPSTPLDSGGITVATGKSATLTWTAVSGAASYNVYKTIYRDGAALPSGAQYGFIGNTYNNTFIDSALNADFSQGPPIPQNPFQGSGVQSIALTLQGSNYTAVPTLTLTAAPPGGTTAQASATLEIATAVANPITVAAPVGTYRYGSFGVIVQILTITPSITYTIINRGSFAVNGIAPSTIVITDSGGVFAGYLDITWRVGSLVLTNPGTGYGVAPGVTFSGGGGGSGAAATTALGAPSSGNPTVPGFHGQRLFLGGPAGSPSQFNMSQPGAPFNFNTTFPVQADNAIQATLTNKTLNSIKSTVSVSGGLVIIADQGAWLVNGGSQGSALSAIDLVANPQAYSGASDLPPIVTPNDIIYVQSKNSIVRDLAYNFYLNNYVGADISIISSHLFYTFQLNEWAWAEEPFKVAWAVRSDGTLLSLTFVKEQELIAWSHSDTNGTFLSVASVTEQVTFGNVDAVYVIAERTINGQVVKYIERMQELYYPQGYISAWQVDAGIGYNGAAATTFSGAQHLAGMACTGLADGVVINFTMPSNGTFIFGPGGTTGLTTIANASVVTVGLAFTPVLGTLALDLGNPTVQGKQKAVTGITIRVADTLGLFAGKESDLSDQRVVKDTKLGEVGSLSNEIVSDLVTTDAYITLPPQYDAFGIYYITQPYPYPASILGVIPEITVGDTK